MYNTCNLVSAHYIDHDISVFIKVHFMHNKGIWAGFGNISVNIIRVMMRKILFLYK
jgi:hypothetical protein